MSSPAPPTTAPSRRAAPMPPEERRVAIVAAVTPLLVEVGESVTSRQLAQAAGVSEGTIFNAFGDKENLLAAVLAAAMDPEPLEAAVAAIDPTASFEARLTEATRLVQRRVVDVWRLVSSLSPRHDHGRGPLPDSPALAALLGAEPGRLRVAPDDAARRLRSLTLALSHPMLAAEPVAPEEIVDQFLHGIGRPPS